MSNLKNLFPLQLFFLIVSLYSTYVVINSSNSKIQIHLPRNLMIQIRTILNPSNTFSMGSLVIYTLKKCARM